jgi:hypothetical protein
MKTYERNQRHQLAWRIYSTDNLAVNNLKRFAVRVANAAEPEWGGARLKCLKTPEQ